VITFDIFFRDHYMQHAKVHNRGWKKKLQMYDLRLAKTFGQKRLDQIKHHEISSWHLALREDGLSPAYSDRFLALFRNSLNKAVEYEMLEKNPAITSLANLTHWSPHSCRHQYASFLVNSGRSLYEVQHCLGHASSTTCERYSHLTSKSLQDAADSASDVIKAAMPKMTIESDPAAVSRDG